MTDPTPAGDLVARFRAGDPTAADKLFTRFARQLADAADAALKHQNARRAADGEDVVQSVFRTFYRRCRAGEFRIDSAGQLWRLLLTITLRKAYARARRPEPTGADDAWLAEAVARDPGPADAAALGDLIATLLTDLPPEHARVLELRLAGHTVAETAAELRLTRQSVYRVLRLLQARLEEISDDRGQIGPLAP
jgi:DNA-directed RNA polymerase specialized sigma24 family protein